MLLNMTRFARGSYNLSKLSCLTNYNSSCMLRVYRKAKFQGDITFTKLRYRLPSIYNGKGYNIRPLSADWVTNSRLTTFSDSLCKK